ncbi:putative GTP-binding protein EngB [Apilactobacillus kunkeei]|uniref:Probable GTP-binding protein EngB n=1 Tax=Apilactobacillus kunkeei TaxID=148814 RepID=A0A0M9DD09_9LACO|nr:MULTISPECIES: ribosome biogenesis GTP-binding protein YihA/YsxC [Apilactobacillus]KOY76358.1 putative GTP-binding protein EngB [Apilactobacillus kunkeei]TMT00250.1 YihA family ribosome biogenesis GTP-binding protein [Apilactobacillus kunkeei]TMT03384.1 YihA family ribosome biogenesis GTP-binding protein [Apilactobacillus kunkeei]CAI2610694.1 putative GTP-binding protein EngB [Apilactobacillus kunkeei]CAI2612183.1 putative GTP-binding protein EngB [Apilactobacillus kunkeei]
MDVHNVNIDISAVEPKQYPSNGYPEIALVGRSNVGKSSLTNVLINRNGYARTSNKPGKTQTLNFYNLDEKLFFVDIPGYGYAKISKAQRAKWGEMIETYLTTRKQLKGVVLLIDGRRAPSQDDLQMYEFLKYYDIPTLVLATKMDKTPKSKWNKEVSILNKTVDLNDGDEIQLFSALSKYGKEEVWKWIESKTGVK